MESPSLNIDNRLDFTILSELKSVHSADESDILDHLIELFVTNSAEVVAGIAQAKSQNDAAEIKRLSHRLKGSSAMIGAKHLSNLCDKMESRHASEEAVGTLEFGQIYGQLKAEVDYVVKHLREFASS